MTPEQLKEYRHRIIVKDNEIVDNITDAMMMTYREVTGKPYDDKLADDIFVAVSLAR